jgi:uncharacterized membrane protein
MKHPATPQWKTELPAIALIVLSFLVGFYFYAHFPEQVPSHWNINGEVDAYSGRFFGAWFVPLLTLGIYLLLLLLHSQRLIRVVRTSNEPKYLHLKVVSTLKDLVAPLATPVCHQKQVKEFLSSLILYC